MSNHDSLHDGNGREEASIRRKSGYHGGSSPRDAVRGRNSHQKHTDYGSEREPSRNRERDRDREREKDQNNHNKGYKDRSSRNDRGHDKYDNYDHLKSRDYDRHRDHGHDRERSHKCRSPSPSRDKPRNRSRSLSSSPSHSKSKRTSGFDMAPPAATVLPGAAVSGQLSGASQAMYGAVQNMLPFSIGQLGTLPLIPAQAMTQQATRHARRVYVGGLPPVANEQTIATFFSQVMAAVGGNSAGPGDSVVNVYINHEKKFAFVEMRTVEEASNAMALDGIIFEGVAVRVRRPTDYNPALAAALGPSQPNPHLNLTVIGLTPGVIGGAEGPDRIFVGGLPYHFTETQIRDLLQSFGPLRGLDIVKDKDTGNSKGYGFCIYQDPTVTDVACAALNGLKMGDKTLTMRRATVSSGQTQSEQENILAHVQQHIAIQKMALQAGGVNISGLGIGSLANETPTKVLCLTELITTDQLRDDEEYGEILEDMRDECSKFGILVNIIIPRPNNEGEEDIPGIGKVFLEYADATGCANARNALSGRKFEGNSVKAVYYPEDRYYSRDYSA